MHLEEQKDASKQPSGEKLKQLQAQQDELECQFSSLFKKKPLLSIKDMQSKTKHVQKNKISDKLNRRDVQYYDLYAL